MKLEPSSDITTHSSAQLDNSTSRSNSTVDVESTEQALHLCSLLKDSAQSVVITDSTGTIIKSNQAFCDLCGYTMEEVTGLNVRVDLTPTEWRFISERIIKNIELGIGPQRYEKYLLQKSGTSIPVEALLEINQDQNGSPHSCTVFVTDIRTQKSVQESLQASEANYRGIFDAANDAIFVMDLAGRLIDANQKVTELLGYTYEEALNLTWKDCSWDPLPYSPNGQITFVEKALAGEPQMFEWRTKDKQGRSFWVDINIKKAFISGEERLLSIIRDVTNRHETIEKLRESEEKYRTIFENTGSATVILDHDGTILLANAETTIYTAYSKEQMEGKMKWFDLFYEGEIDRLRELHYLRRTHPGEAPRTYDFTIRSRFGGKRSFLITVDIIPGTSMSVASLLDVTGYQQFRKSVWLAEKVIESLAEGILLTSPHGRIIGFNPSLSMMTGYQTEEITGNTMEMFIPDEYKWNIKGLRFGQDGRWQGESFCRRKDGTIFPIWVSVSPVYEQPDHLTNYVTVIIDNTLQEILRQERRNFKEYQVRAERLASMSTISAGVIHEISQPLNAITLLSDGMLFWQEKTDHINPAEAVEAFRNINIQVGRINDIIRHVRTFDNIKRVQQPQYCELNVAVEGALDLLAHQISSHGIKVTLELADHLPQVVGNYVHLEEVIINLLANAMQALDSSAKEHKKIFCRTYLQETRLVLEIEDNAGGIRDNIIGHIFEPFFTTRGGDNMGFGLAIVRSILDIYDAKITVFNNEDTGAIFRIEFVAAQNPFEIGEHFESDGSR